jgi:hypothetical protein
MNLDKTITRALWAAAAVIVFSLLIGLIGPGTNPNLAGGFDSVTLAAELAPTKKDLLDAISGQQSRFQWSVWLDFPLILSYTLLFWFSARMEIARGKGHLVPGIIAALAIWIAGAADVAEDLGELYPDRFPQVMHLASVWKWGVLGVVLLAVSFLFFKWQPLATEFHVALAAAAFFSAVAGLIAVYGALVAETKLERVAPAMALGILTEAGILLFRRDKFTDHVLNRIAPAVIAPR